jgi:hypothetical protein
MYLVVAALMNVTYDDVDTKLVYVHVGLRLAHLGQSRGPGFQLHAS